MKKNNADSRLLSMLICLSVSVMLILTTTLTASAATEVGEVINSAEQGTTGAYTVETSGYYLINLRGADGGDGQDVEIESDGVGSYDKWKGHQTADGGEGADGGSVSTLVYLKKGQTISYSIGADGTNYVERAYRWENLQRGCIHVYPNSNPIYKIEEYVDAGFGGGGGEGTWVSVDDVVIAGAAGGGGGGGSVAACANWGSKDPSGFKAKGANGGDAAAVASVISEEFDSIESFNGEDGVKSKGRSEIVEEDYYPSVFGHPSSPRFELTEFEAGEGGASGTSYINKASDFYYGDNVPTEVADASEYQNAAKPQTSGIVITFIYAHEFPIKIEFTGGTASGEKDTTTIEPGDTVTIEIPKPSTSLGYFKGWFNKKNNGDSLVRDYYGSNTIEASYDDLTSSEYEAEWYDTSKMGKENVSNAKAQAVVVGDGAGGTKNVIRFLAMIDGDYKTYKKAGFIISADCATPTIEAGYQYSSQYAIYRSILNKSADTGKITYTNVNSADMENLFGFKNGVGLMYTNLTIKEGNEDVVYNATPYIVNAQGEYVYGKARAISLNALKGYDTAIIGE